MSGASIQVSGNFDITDGGIGPLAQTVISDFLNGTGWTAGAIRAENLQVQPTLVEQWTIVGWTMRARMMWGGVPGAFPGLFGAFGDLWAGLLVDNALHNAGGQTPGGSQRAGGGDFPQDLSTFAKIWDGRSDPIKRLPPGATQVSATDAMPIGVTFMLPAPVTVKSGTQLQMVLILTPSLLQGNLALFVVSADFTVIYENA